MRSPGSGIASTSLTVGRGRIKAAPHESWQGKSGANPRGLEQMRRMILAMALSLVIAGIVASPCGGGSKRP
jgi:hypothetical protein